MAGWGAARQNGVRCWGAACYLTVRCRTLEMPCVGDEELLLLRSSTDRSRGLPFSEPGLPFSVLSMSYLVAHGGQGQMGKEQHQCQQTHGDTKGCERGLFRAPQARPAPLSLTPAQ